MSYDLHLDIESLCEVDLRTEGLDRYTAHPSFRIQMVSWKRAYKDRAEPTSLWIPGEQPIPKEFREALRDPAVLLKAWNAQFERVSFARGFKIRLPYARWRCTMVRAMALSLPGSLDECGKVMRLPGAFQKDAEGKRLIRLFCIPHTPTKAHPYRWYNKDTHPEDWAKFCAYCIKDTESEWKIDRILSKFPIPESEWSLYALDQKINDRGVPVDLRFVDNAIAIVKRRKAEAIGRLARITGVANPNSGAQILPWFNKQGYPFQDLKKQSVAKAIADFGGSIAPVGMEALLLRQIVARTSTTKLTAIRKRVGADGRLRFNFQFNGAGRTGRWAGRGVQLQNLPRPRKEHEKILDQIRERILANDYDGLVALAGDPLSAVVSCIRAMIAAGPGKELRVADLSSIETRLAGYHADCAAINDVFASGKCVYKTFATKLFDVPYDEVTKEQRGVSKPATLGGVYMLSGGKEVGTYPLTEKTGLLGYADAMGVKLTEAQASQQVQAFREWAQEVVELWAELEAAAFATVRTQKPHKVKRITFDLMPPFLRMVLPSGRAIYYLRPQLKTVTIKHASGEFTKLSLTYEGYNLAKQWVRVNTHPGKILENWIQADGRETLAAGLVLADAVGFNIVMHVHDEIGNEERIDDTTHTLDKLIELMSVTPKFLPGLLLDAAGYVSPYLKKD